MKKLIISPPFSNLFKSKRFTRIIGTYTLKQRKGLHRVLTTLRWTRLGWTNRAGLRNPGILKAKPKGDDIVSVSLFYGEKWQDLREALLKIKAKYIELNVSCPNASVNMLSKETLEDALENFEIVILKLPHGCDLNVIERYYSEGIRYFHISNTVMTDKGALSGRLLVNRNCMLIRDIRRLYGNEVVIIGGGGIYDKETLSLYEDAGANHFSLSTILLHPIKFIKLISIKD